MKITLCLILSLVLFKSEYCDIDKIQYHLFEGYIKIVDRETAIYFPCDEWKSKINLSYKIYGDSICFNSKYQKNQFNEHFKFNKINKLNNDSIVVLILPKNPTSEYFSEVKFYDKSYNYINYYSFLFDRDKLFYLPKNATYARLSIEGKSGDFHKLKEVGSYNIIIVEFDYLDTRQESRYTFFDNFKLKIQDCHKKVFNQLYSDKSYMY